MLLLPAAVVLLKRTLRELTVTLAGMLLPLLTACYLNWATGAPFDAPLQQAVELFTHNDGMHLWNLPWPALLLPGALLLLDIASLAAYLNSVYSVGFKARGILALAGCMLLLTVAVALLPCATSVALLLCALPTALLAPFLLVRMHYALSLALYTLLLVWALAAPYLWAQLTAALR